MKVLITGATGFLGSHLTHRLVHDGHEVTILRRPTSDVAGLESLSVIAVVGDVTDRASLDAAIKGQEVVIHAAADVVYRGGARNYQATVNVEGTRNVVLACRRHRVRRLVHVSSVAAIGILDGPGPPADETFPWNLENSGLGYHGSKRRAEAEVLEGVRAGLDAVVVNPGSICGPFARGFRGREFIEGVVQRPIVPYFLGGRNVVHVGDVVDGIIGALERGETGERYILGGENLTYRRIAELVAGCLGLRRVLVPVPSLITGLAATILEPLGRLTRTRPRITYDIHYCAGRFAFYDSAKARGQFKFAPRPFADIVQEYVERSAPR
jgi:dihydroflavonol-4-reductase